MDLSRTEISSFFASLQDLVVWSPSHLLLRVSCPPWRPSPPPKPPDLSVVSMVSQLLFRPLLFPPPVKPCGLLGLSSPVFSPAGLGEDAGSPNSLSYLNFYQVLRQLQITAECRSFTGFNPACTTTIRSEYVHLSSFSQVCLICWISLPVWSSESYSFYRRTVVTYRFKCVLCYESLPAKISVLCDLWLNLDNFCVVYSLVEMSLYSYPLVRWFVSFVGIKFFFWVISFIYSSCLGDSSINALEVSLSNSLACFQVADCPWHMEFCVSELVLPIDQEVRDYVASTLEAGAQFSSIPMALSTLAFDAGFQLSIYHGIFPLLNNLSIEIRGRFLVLFCLSGLITLCSLFVSRFASVAAVLLSSLVFVNFYSFYGV